jgi:hypothetical protein
VLGRHAILPEARTIVAGATSNEGHRADSVSGMAVLVDQAIWQWRGRRWAHLVSDVSYEELHVFAERLGIPRRAFQGDHYDVPDDYRTEAIRLGALAVDARVLVRRLRASGLRRARGATDATAAAPTPPAPVVSRGAVGVVAALGPGAPAWTSA